MRLNVHHASWTKIAPDLDERKRRELCQRTIEELARRGVLVRTRYSEDAVPSPIVQATKHERKLFDAIVADLAHSQQPPPAAATKAK